jgi:hypothetical protein
MRVKCSQVHELLSAYADAAVDAETAQVIERHLAGCKDCAADLEDLRATLAALRSLEKVRAPADFLDRIHDRLMQPSAGRRLLDKVFLPLRLKLPLELAGVVVTTLLIVLTYQEIKSTRQTHPAFQVQAPPPVSHPASEPAPMMAEQRTPPSAEPAQPSRSLRKREEQPTLILTLTLKCGREPDTRAAEADTQQPALTGSGKAMQAPPRSSMQQEARPAPPAPLPERAQSAPAQLSTAGEAKPPVDFKDESLKKQNVGQLPPEAPGKAGVRREAPMKLRAASPSAPDQQGQTQTSNEPEGGAPPGSPAGQGQQPATPEVSPDHALADIQKLIEQLDGKILRVEYTADTHQPRSLEAQIPTRRYRDLVARLQRMGTFRAPPPAPLAADTAQLLRLQIRFVP